jgi:bzd-type benzoyl-CoA reductase N subunit
MASEALARLLKMRDDPYASARAFKERTGGKVIGYFCCLAPEEMIHAAGALPVRITGENREPSSSGAHLQSYCCSLARTGLDMALDGSLSFMDGTVFVHTCDTMQRLSDIWRLNAGFAIHGDVVLPVRFESDSAWQYMIAELDGFRSKMSAVLGPIEDDALSESIRLYNTNRALLGKLYEIHRASPDALPYEGLLWCSTSSALMEKAEHNALLQAIVDEVGSPESEPSGVPLFGIGSVMDQWDFLAMVDESGGTFIDDDFCNGRRYFDAMVPEDVPPVEGLARRLWDRNTCACKHRGTDDRAACIVERAKGAGAKGAVFFQFKYCEPHAFDYPHVKKALDEANIPSLSLEIEQGSVSIEQLRTRIGALVETIKS